MNNIDVTLIDFSLYLWIILYILIKKNNFLFMSNFNFILIPKYYTNIHIIIIKILDL